MNTIFNMPRDSSGAPTFAPQFSDTGAQTNLAANVAQSYTVPTLSAAGYTKVLAVFSYDPGLRVFVANGATAAVPGGSFAATVSELNPTARYVNSGDVLSFITPDTNAYANIKFYAIQ